MEKGKTVSTVQERIKKDVEMHPVILFMKGSKLMPLCGFSGQVVEVLSGFGIDFETRNVLEDDELRQGIKTYSNWPTLPQLYIKGEFIGGCDIIMQLHEQGELEKLLRR